MRRFTHTFPQRISAFLLCLALLVGLLPTSALAAGTDTGKAIQLGTSGISGYDSPNGYDYIYYGTWNNSPIKWRVLDDQTNFDSDSDGTNDAGLFLLSDVLLGTGYSGGVYFQQSYHYDSSSDTYHKGSAPSGGDHTNCQIANAWQGSDAQSWCKDFAGIEGNSVTDAFSSAELAAILKTTKSDNTYSYFAASENILNGDKVFFLSAQEAENNAYGFGSDDDRKANYNGSEGSWWLRSPDAIGTSLAGFVRNYGDVNDIHVLFDWAARPAFNLNLNSVLFTSAAVGGKTDSAVDSSLTAVKDYASNEWKLTLLDSDRSGFTASTSIQTIGTGKSLSITYSGAQTGSNEYVSAMLVDGSGSVLYYGRVANNSANGKASITIPDGLAAGNYTLKVFSEQYNGDKMTDYASAFVDIPLAVTDATPPTLAAGDATRTGETTATVKFTSDEAGSYYYAVAESGAAEPDVNTSGTGTPCDTTEQTISLDSLTGADAKDIYIVVKDAAGNVSEKLKITIPAIYTLTVNLNGGSGSTTGGQYPAGEVVHIDAGRRSNYRFNGWTSSNGGSFADASSANTTFTMPAADTTITANWQYDPPYIPPTKPDGPSTGTSDGWEGIVDELADAEDGDTITIDMNGETEVPGDIWEAIAGKDVTVILDMGGNVSWTVDGNDVPTATHFADMDFGVDRNTSGISVDVINTVTGELGSVQITLAHDGEFGFALTLSAPLGKENAGYWANLYHYDENAKTLNYETSAQVASDGTASLRMTHASQYAIIIDEQSHELPFTDVASGTWYEGAVRYAYLHDIMEGMSATKFSPNISLTRAQAVQVLYNLEGQPTVSGNAAFPDQVEEWYKPAIAWAEQTGVVDGYEDGTFRPGQPVNRMEFAQMLYNYAKYKGYDLTAQGDLTAFPDGDSVQPWAETAMTWANGNQLINGHDDGTIDAAGIGTRAQAASILMRFDQNLVKN